MVVRSARLAGLCVENRRLKAILPDPPPPGRVQTIRGEYSYDPARDIAEAARAAIRVAAPSGPATSSAWIGNCRLESWYQTNGTARHLASYDLESAGRDRLRLTMPPEIAPTNCAAHGSTTFPPRGKPTARGRVALLACPAVLETRLDKPTVPSLMPGRPANTFR